MYLYIIGGYPFLILILIGLYFNAGYIISLTFERSKVQCILIYILKNLVSKPDFN